MRHEPIAIIGRGCVLPGALDTGEYWANLVAGRSCLSAVPPGRWRLPGGRPGAEDPDDTRWVEAGGYVSGFDAVFDPTGFAVDAAEIMRLDPMFHWVLYAARQALREARQDPRPAVRAGLSLGNLTYPSAALTDLADSVWREGRPDPGIDPLNRFCAGLPAQFAARALGLTAGGFAVDAACASSLYAVKLACDRLADGTADLMLAGAVNAPDDLLINHAFRALSALSRTGRSRPFHRDADGLVPGEGAVMVALMRLADARRTDVPILGVIRGVGLSNDGQAGGLLAPDEGGQVRAMRQAYEAAGVPPESVTLLECHATGTPVGDGVEVRSSAHVFAASTGLPIGSAKSNLGHLLATAGGAGLLKVLGAIQAGVRPPTLHADEPTAALDGTPLRLLTEPEEWPGPRRAAVSAFAFGGANAHLIVDAPDLEPAPSRSRVPDSERAPSRSRESAESVPPHQIQAAAPEPRVAITALGVKAADGADTDAFRRAVLLGRPQRRQRTGIDVALPGLRIPPVDLQAAHPQHVLILEAAREAVGDRNLPRERTMVIVGMGTDPELARYAVLRRGAAAPDAPQAEPLTAAGVVGMMPNLLANRINAQFDLAGAGYTVCAEEASGLVALELGARALRAGEADAVVVGAVDLSCEPVHEAAAAAAGIERPTGDAAVVLVLRRLADAQDLGEQVIATLDGDRPDLVVGDDAAAALDPADLVGSAHAAYGLVGVAAAALAAQHRVLPRPDGAGEAARRALTARVSVRPLGGAAASATLSTAEPAQPWIREAAPSLHVYSGPDRAGVLRALADGRESPEGPARLAIVALPGEAPAARTETITRWLTSGGPRPTGVAYRDAPVHGEVAAVFTNGGASYPGMGTEVALAFPAAAETVATRGARVSGVLEQIAGAAWLGRLHAEIVRTVLGLRPAAAIGYSSGESAALLAMGAWPDADGFAADLAASDVFADGLTGEFLAVRRAWRKLGRHGERWANHLVTTSADRVRTAIGDEPTVHVLAVLAPDSCVVGGEAAACATVLDRLDAESIVIEYDIAAHAPELAEVAEEYRRLHLRPTADAGGVRFYSGATGESYLASAERAADAIVAQGLDTVDFVRVIERAWADGVRIFVEHGPQGQCTGWIRRILGDREYVAVALDAPDDRALWQLCTAVAELVAAGVPVDAAGFFAQLDRAGRDSGSPAGPAVKRLPAHPPALHLPRPAPATTPPVPAVPSPPDIPPPAPAADFRRPAPAAAPVPQPPVPVGAPAGIARLIAAQFRHATSRHQEYLAHQTRAQAQYLDARRRLLSITTAGAARAAAGAPVPGGHPGPRFGRAELERLSDGPISELFGADFAALDGRPRQTRLPKPPLLLVDRVTGIDAVPASMGTGTLWTETDVRLDSWYLDASGRMPAGLMIEAGQADLLLISWLGVDLRHDGDRVYRLLGCELTFHGGPARPGETLRFEIRIERQAEQDGTRLFFFGYDCFVGDELRMTVRQGQAGFFTDDELARAEGLAWDPAYELPEAGEVIAPRRVPAASGFDRAAVRAFAAGRPDECFGAEWAQARAHLRTPRIGEGRMLLLDRVTELDPRGGPRGDGYLRAETAVDAADWFFDCHFKNDPCMPATLMYEGGLQAMAFYLAALGFTVDHDGWRFEPVPGQTSVLRCRGQVSPASRRIVYEVFVTGLTADPCPTLHADLLCTVDGVAAFHARGAALRLVPDWPLDHWRHLGPPYVQPTGEPVPFPALGGLRGLEPGDDRAAVVDGVRQDQAALLSFAWGRLGEAMGPRFARFDRGRRAPRLPGPPYHFLSRIADVAGALGDLRAGSAVTAEYDVPERAWYFEPDGTMPLAVLMEVALQPCGWLATYAGSFLDADTDLRFRNLDGTMTVHREVAPGTGTLRTRAELLHVSRSEDVIVESFRVACATTDGNPVLELETSFGFFTDGTLRQQAGLPAPAPERPGTVSIDPYPRVPAGPLLRMLDRVTGCWPDAGPAGLGQLRAERDVAADDWYFTAHFFQDPVQPGSLGVEAICQLLQWHLAGGAAPGARLAPVLTGTPLTWKYRGQVTPANHRITIDLEITERGEDSHGEYAVGTAWLRVDGLPIYEVRGLGARLVRQ